MQIFTGHSREAEVVQVEAGGQEGQPLLGCAEVGPHLVPQHVSTCQVRTRGVTGQLQRYPRLQGLDTRLIVGDGIGLGSEIVFRTRLVNT